MSYQQTPLQGLWVFEPRVFRDHRGFFYESFNYRNFIEATGFTGHFVQDNHSLSVKGVMRGLHCQLPPHDQSKLVRTVKGEVLDVAVDVRKESTTYKQYFSIVLSAENKKQLFIPKGFLHGFIVLSEEAELLYKCDHYYTPSSEAGIIYNDPEIGIDWQTPEEEIVISDKDLALKTLAETALNF